MSRIRSIGSLIALAGLVFLLFLFTFADQLSVPSWLQVLGRMHPLLLHFPIVLVLISLFSYWIPQEAVMEKMWEIIRLSAALSALASAIMGIFLSVEQGGEGSTLLYHKWSGTALAVIAWALYVFHAKLATNRSLAKSVSIGAAFLLVVTGHLGANLTHGENFLSGPILGRSPKKIDPEQAVIFTDLIYPVLEEKCGACHQAGNQKGGLSLVDSAAIMAGGKTGKALVLGDLEKSLLISRLHLPMSDKKHMPVASKPQLTPEELELLQAWVKAGAPFAQKLRERNSTDSLRISADAYIHSRQELTEDPVYDFAEADPDKIKTLSDNYRVIKPLGKNSPALAVSFFGKAMFTPARLNELEPLKKQIIHLNLSKMPVTDEQLSLISGFQNLERVNLNYTDITNAGMQYLVGMKKLSSVSLSGTAIDTKGLEALAVNQQIKEVYVWDSRIPANAITAIQQKYPQLKIETGFQGADTTVVKLNKPLLKTPEGFFRESGRIILAHVIRGAELRYTLNGLEPDSSTSLIYKEPITITQNTILQVKAFKKGWLSSDVVKASFLKAGLPVINTTLLQPADVKYNMGGGKILTDLDLGDQSDFSSKWLGFQKNKASVVFDLGAPLKVEEVQVNALHGTRAHVFPPVSLTIWGSTDEKNWRLLSTQRPPQPDSIKPATAFLYQLHFKTTTARYIRLEAQPVPKLPHWHPAAGKPAWFFMSEVSIY
jgi:uncharacterized membrane protein